MKNLRFWIIALIIWLIFFFNVTRLNSPISLRAYTYIFVAVAVAGTLILPRLQKVPFPVFLLTLIPIFLWLKATLERGDWYSNLLTGYALPITATQISAIIFSGLLARQISIGLQEFEDVIAGITFDYIGKLPRPFSDGQGAMYREVKRARRYNRPVAVIALKVNEEDIRVALPQMVKEVQQAMMREYVLAGIARILNESIHDFDTIALHDNNFILVLPEISSEEATRIAHQVEENVKERMKVRLQVGTATFPDEAMTFESLVELALKHTYESPMAIQPTPNQVIGRNLGDVRL